MEKADKDHTTGLAKQTHKLAVIMFTDIVGYTALMDKDEDKAFAVLRKSLKIQRSVVEKYNGNWLKEIGDGVLISFGSTSKAVACAREIMTGVNKEPELDLRIGLHLGEVRVKDGDVFGSGVNIASRIQELAPPNGIWISESVYRDIANKKDFITEFVGEKKLKHVQEPIKLYEVNVENVPSKSRREISKPTKVKNWLLILTGLGLIILLASIYYYFFNNSRIDNNSKIEHQLPTSFESYQSVTIFPFKYIGSDQSKSWLAEAMTEEVRRNVAQIPKIRVTPAISSAIVYEQKDLDLQEMSEKLNVRYIVEGSLQVNVEEAQLNFSLTDVRANDIVLIETINFHLKDLFTTQNQAADLIAVTIRPIFVHPPGKLDVEKNVDPAAFEKYLEGKYAANFQNKESSFLASIKIDSNFSLGYAGLAELYLNMAHFGHPGHEVFPKSISYAEKSLALDSNSYIGLTALADCNYHYNYNWDLSEKYFNKVISIDPSYAQTYLYFSGMLSAMNRHDEALFVIEKGREIDPFHLYTLTWKIRSYYWARDLDNARKTFLEVTEREKGRGLHGWREYSLLFPDSNHIEILQNVVSANPNNLGAKIGLAIAYSLNSQLAVAEEIYTQLIPELKLWAPSYLAKIDVHLGRYENAFEMLDLAYELKDASLIWINADASFDPIREDPRFQVLIEKMNLKNYPPY